MTTDELAAIRARDADYRDDCPADTYWIAADDRRALLAEVDRLTSEYVTDVPYSMDIAKKHERARIRAAVEGLPVSGRGSISWDKTGGLLPGSAGLTLFIDGDMTEEYVDRAAVLAAIDGGEK